MPSFTEMRLFLVVFLSYMSMEKAGETRHKYMWFVHGWNPKKHNDDNLFRESSKHEGKQQFPFYHVPLP